MVPFFLKKKKKFVQSLAKPAFASGAAVGNFSLALDQGFFFPPNQIWSSAGCPIMAP